MSQHYAITEAEFDWLLGTSRLCNEAYIILQTERQTLWSIHDAIIGMVFDIDRHEWTYYIQEVTNESRT